MPRARPKWFNGDVDQSAFKWSKYAPNNCAICKTKLDWHDKHAGFSILKREDGKAIGLCKICDEQHTHFLFNRRKRQGTQAQCR